MNKSAVETLPPFVMPIQVSDKKAHNSTAVVNAMPVENHANIACVDPDAYIELGLALQEMGNYAEAAQTYQKAIALQPDSAELHAFLGICQQASGKLSDAADSYREAVRLNPDYAQASSNLGVILQELGESDAAIAALQNAIKANPAFPEAYANLGVIWRAVGNMEKAINTFRTAIALKPNYAEAHANLGACLHKLGQLEEALASVRIATLLNANYAQAHADLGLILYELSRPGEAAVAFYRALLLGAKTAELYSNYGVTLQELGRQDEAVAAYQQAIVINPDFPDTYSNFGVALLEMGKNEEAANMFRRAAAINPQHPHAYSNLSIALHEMGKDDEAAAASAKAIELHPNDADARSNFAMVRIHQQRFDEAISLLLSSADMNQNHGRVLASKITVPAHRIKHDHEQISLLKQRGLLKPEYLGYADHLASLAAAVEQSSPSTETLTIEGDSVARIAPSYNKLVYTPATPNISRPFLNPQLDVKTIERNYLESEPEVVYIDDFLSPAALNAIRDFCHEATIWKKEYGNGYLGATLKDGFVSPLIMLVAEELRNTFPQIFQKHLLEQAWAFKYDSTMKGINVHADFAAVNVNFWITRDEACLNPESGGLVIWDKASPKDWSFSEYNGDESRIRKFLTDAGARSIRVPYRENRCVIFNSTLFHETDQFEFNDAYQDRRINVTFLYGKGLRLR